MFELVNLVCLILKLLSVSSRELSVCPSVGASQLYQLLGGEGPITVLQQAGVRPRLARTCMHGGPH